jgi:hypothetical protein
MHVHIVYVCRYLFDALNKRLSICRSSVLQFAWKIKMVDMLIYLFLMFLRSYGLNFHPKFKVLVAMGIQIRYI